MADGDERQPANFRLRLENSSNSEDSEGDDHVGLDLGVNLNKTRRMPTQPPELHAATGSVNRKEENPFSFKHFLKSDKNYRNQGARPKVYCEGRPISSISDIDLQPPTDSKQTRIVPEFSSALPDFVQDHLVVEQCYLGKEGYNSNYNVDVNNLPDFTPTRSSLNINRLHIESSRDKNGGGTSSSSNSIGVPLDLPVRPPVEFPLDLPVVDTEPCTSRNYPSNSEVGVSKSLPDFLADGAVRSQQNDSSSNMQSPEWESERLHRELEYTRRMMNEHAKRADILQRELEIARHKEQEYTENFVKSLEQAEENLGKSLKRAASAESTVAKLKQEIKILTNQVTELQRENMILRRDEGAAGGPIPSTSNDIHSQRLAQELRNAANTAEHSLRQLLTGVDNLRIMASTLENINRIEERTDKFLDLDDEAGPAL